MTEHIFKRFTPLKKDIFNLVINEMLRVGWKQLNEGKPTANDVYVMYSNGNDGKKNIYIELIPYDGRYMEVNTQRLNYDVRSTVYSDAFYKFCNGYNNDTGRGITPDESWPTSWFRGRNYSDRFTSTGPKIAIDTEIEFYLFVDKEKIITCTIPPVSVRTGSAVTYIGVLGGLMLEEKHEPYTRALVSYASAWSGNYTTVNQGLTFNRPKGSNETATSQSYRSSWLQIPTGLNPNIDGTFLLLPFYIMSDSYGVRGKLEGIYRTSETNIVSGDILEIEANGKIQKYKYVNAVGSYGSLPAPLAFRIE
ncbi:hypothetical protein COF80_02605 [Bacillus toyonensis]|uniref:hypothetical protein n=1 Tax=Bacillus toyonensis TaxID=155322 RepID=UPI000BEFC204|nr:hypothetical protein [Bacillus toyonensis]PEK46038.1 hypothetical protein CN586_14885 [Bacillus toyonensis]PHE89366.1 hypothetical protein COF80_02605 [Bacillus toyonensis]